MQIATFYLQAEEAARKKHRWPTGEEYLGAAGTEAASREIAAASVGISAAGETAQQQWLLVRDRTLREGDSRQSDKVRRPDRHLGGE